MTATVSPERPQRLPVVKTIPAVVGLLLLTCFLLFAHHGYPVPGGDSINAQPPTLSVALGRGLYNRIRSDMLDCDPSGAKRWVCYGFLYNVLLGKLLPEPTPQALFLAVAVINCLSLGFCWMLFLQAVRWTAAPSAAPGRRFWPTLLVSLALIGISTRLLGQSSRQESLATLIVLMGVNGAAKLPARHRFWPLGLSLGLMAATHPAGTVLLSLAILLYYALTSRISEWCQPAAKTLGLGVAVFSVCFLFFPYSLADWLAGMAHLSRSSLLAIWASSFWQHWIINPAASFYGFLSAVFLAAAVHLWLVQRRRIPQPAVAGVLAALLLFAVYFFSLRCHTRNYNVLLFAPLFFALLIYYTLSPAAFWGGTFRPARVVRLVIFSCFILAGSGFLRATLLFPAMLREGVSLSQLRDFYASHRQTFTGRIGVSESMWVIAEEQERFFALMLFRPLDELARSSTLIVQQSYSGLISPPAIPAHVLQYDFFQRRRPTLWGIPLARVNPGYGFAVYAPLASRPPP